ncbi:hypothetical protein [Morganella morganii]|uniref:hypothetical protein n=1 Tax=Morganella morganii TaxID=582 RepID=UPI0023683ABD|nr:hypothetical protein [Morganella morganii]
MSPGYMLTHAGKPSAVKPQPEKPVVPVKPAEKEKPWLTPMTEQCEGKAEIGGEFYVSYINLLAEAVMRDQLNGNVAEVLSSIRMALPQADTTPPAAKESVSTDLKAAEHHADNRAADPQSQHDTDRRHYP